MRISARCDYICKATLALAEHWPDERPLQMQTISKKEGIPLKYLPQVLLQLKRLGIAKSIRGKQGGYILARPPHKINFGELMRVVSGPLVAVVDSAFKRKTVFAEIWNEAEEAMAKVLDEITFDDIVRRAKNLEEAIVYQI